MILGFTETFPDKSPTNFIQKIEFGVKNHSLREDKHDRWKEGMKIEIATGVRSKNYKCHFYKICTGTQQIEIKYLNKCSDYPIVYIDKVKFVYYNKIDLEVLQQLAKNDGFNDFDHFCQWFIFIESANH